MILNHFIKRRIGTETFTEFQINLCVKLNSIMPTYNKLFNIISKNEGFGETIEKSGINDRNTNSNITSILNAKNNSTTNGENITDNRSSELPQSELENIQDGSYVGNYTYNKDSSNSSDNSESENKSSSNSNTNDNTEYKESTTRTNILEIYTQLFQLSQNTLAVYDMIFKELNSLFYSLV